MARCLSNWDSGAPVNHYLELLPHSNEQLAKVDPQLMNLLVAKSIPSLAGLDVPRYQQQAGEWAAAITESLPGAERVFRKTPHYWKNDINFFRLGVLCELLEKQAGIAYREDQRNMTEIYYADPTDLFLNGVMDTRRGTCCNMAALHVALGWRLGWPASLAYANTHLVCRYDDGKVAHNIEAAQSGCNGWPKWQKITIKFKRKSLTQLIRSKKTTVSRYRKLSRCGQMGIRNPRGRRNSGFGSHHVRQFEH